MEIRNILEPTGFPASNPAPKPEEAADSAVRSSADRVEQSRRWVEQMEAQRAQLLALLDQSRGQDKENKSGGVLDMLDGLNEGKEEIDAMSQQLKMRMKCLEIARRIMQGKKVPAKDERYLMENDPKGYQLAMALRKPPKKDEKECKSVLDDEDEQSSKASDSEEMAPTESGSGESAASDSECSAEQ